MLRTMYMYLFLLKNVSIFYSILLLLIPLIVVVLRFYGPVNPMGSCQAQSVYLTTCLLGRLNPLSG